jgi:hypothetical protein
MADTVKRAANKKDTAGLIRTFRDEFGKKLELEKNEWNW